MRKKFLWVLLACVMAFSLAAFTACEADMTDEDTVRATGVTLNETSISLAVGEQFQLEATPTPADTTEDIRWSVVTTQTSGTNVAKVSPDGLVTAVSAGTATIQVQVGTAKATCEVTVTDNGETEPEPPVEVESVTVTPETAQVDIAGTVSLTAELAPAGATGTVVWSTEDDTVATVSQQGVVTGVSEGKTTITATVGEFSDTCVVSVFPNTISVNGTAYSMRIGTARTTSTGTDPANTWWSLNEEGQEDPAYNSGNIGSQQLNGDGAIAFYWTKDAYNEYNSDLVFELMGNISETATYYDAQVFNGPTTPWGGLGVASSTQLSVTVNGEAYSGDTFPGLDASGAQANNTTFSMYGDYRAVFARSGNYCTLQIAFAQANSSDVYVYTYTFELVSGTPDALTVQFVGNPYGIENTMQYTSVTLNAVNA